MKKLLLLFTMLLVTTLSSNAQINSVAIVGQSAGGWPQTPGNPGPIDIHQMATTDGVNWTLSSITLTTFQLPDDGIKFRANNDWAINWGSTAFPIGTGNLNGNNIECVAGTYSVTFNSNTGGYVFTSIGSGYPTIAIVGTATAQGWPNDPQTDANQLTTTDGVTYRTNFVTLTANELKFRQDNSWSVSWGGLTFPTGPQTGNESNNIVVTTPGTYRCVFNRTNGQYAFDFPSIAIVGEAVGGWPGEPGNPGPIDVHQLTTTDGETYTISNLVVTTATSGGGVKFRQDNAWSTSWGNEAFPSASSSNGNNIVTVAGTYNVTFSRSTGAYAFTNALSNTNFTATKFSVYPNPTNTNWNFNTNNESLNSIEIIDISGKIVITTKENNIDASILNQGIYFAKISTDNSQQIIKLIKN
jgi:hypothetical protein